MCQLWDHSGSCLSLGCSKGWGRRYHRPVFKTILCITEERIGGTQLRRKPAPFPLGRNLGYRMFFFCHAKIVPGAIRHVRYVRPSKLDSDTRAVGRFWML